MSVMQNKVYLAGAITSLTYEEGQDWRSYAMEKLKEAGINAFSPLRAKDYLTAHGSLEGSYEDYPMSTAKGIMTRDHFDCMTADVILVNLHGTKKVSIGTVMEMAWAFAYKKPVVLVMDERNIHNHPMLEQAAGFTVTTLDDGLKIVKAILLPS